MIGSRVRHMATYGAAVGLSAGLVLTGLSVTTASASGTPGVTAGQVTIGATVPLTGIASPGYNEVAKAANAVFRYINTKPGGKINGRTINYVLKDDCYGTPGFGCTGTPNTATQTNALLALPVFATVGSLGTPTQDSVRATLKANGTPQLFVNSGSKDWNNPGTYPGLFGYQPSYNVESKVLAKYIKATYGSQKVCFLGQNDDFGLDGHQGLVTGGVNPAPADTKYYNVVNYVISGSAYIKPFVQGFKTDACKVVFLDTIPAVTAGVLASAKSLTFAPHWVISSVGSDPITVNNVLKGKGTETGAISFAPLAASTDTNKNAKLWKTWMTKVLVKDKADFPKFTASSPIDGNMAYGIGFGVAFAEALKAAGTNFTQSSFVHLLETTTFAQTPSLLPLKYSASNHQGLLGGYIIKIASTKSTSPINQTVYVTDNGGGAVTVSGSRSAGIPSWLS